MIAGILYIYILVYFRKKIREVVGIRRVATFTSKRPGVHIEKKRRLRKEKNEKKNSFTVTNIVEEMGLGV